MRKTILMVLMAVVSSSAAAEWVVVGSGKDQTHYVDPATIRRSGNKVKMWFLLDYKTAIRDTYGKPFLSYKGQDEYDCEEETVRSLAVVFHSENMGGGDTVFSHSGATKWSPAAPGTGSRTSWETACAKPVAWLEVAATKEWTVYADPASVRKSGEMSKMPTLMDFRTTQKGINGKSFLSGKTEFEYDCKGEQVRSIQFSLYSGHMGFGQVVLTDVEPENLEPIPPNSFQTSLVKIACGKQ